MQKFGLDSLKTQKLSALELEFAKEKLMRLLLPENNYRSPSQNIDNVFRGLVRLQMNGIDSSPALQPISRCSLFRGS